MRSSFRTTRISTRNAIDSLLLQLGTPCRRSTISGSRRFDELRSKSSRHWQMGTMTGPILKGKHHQDIPVLQPKRFELVINSKAARLLHLSIPLQMWVIADEINRVLAFLLRCTSPELAQRARAIVRPRQKSRVVRTKTEAIGDSVRRSSRLRAASAPTCMITAARLKHAPTLGYLLD